MSDIQTHKIIKKSRKEHLCHQCGIIIPKGTTYSFVSGIFDNEPYSQKNHIECYEKYMYLNRDSGPYDWYEISEGGDFKEHKEKMIKKYEGEE